MEWMNEFKKIGFNILRKKIEDKDAKIYELLEYDHFNIGDENIQKLKILFQDILIDFINKAEDDEIDFENNFKVIIPPEFIEGLKNKSYKLMEKNNGQFLPNIVDKNNKIVKILELDKLKMDPSDYDLINQLDQKILQQNFDDIHNRLSEITQIANDIHKGLQHDRYALVIGASRLIEQAKLERGRNQKVYLQNAAQTKLNQAIATLEQELEVGIQYFEDWEKRGLFNVKPFSEIEKKFNKLVEDYLYLTNAKTSLIELKHNQGMSDDKLKLIIMSLKDFDLKIKEANIDNWLPPKTTENAWQHDLLKNGSMKNRKIVLEYDAIEIGKE